MTGKPVCLVAQRESPELYSGTPSFAGVPVARDSAGLQGCDAAILGVPWEGVCTWGGFSGCELGPKAIRSASLRYGGYFSELGYDLFDHLCVVDYGDTGVFPGDPERTFREVRSRARDVLASGAVCFALGGDHSISAPIVEAAGEAHGRIGVIQLDAHFDNMDQFGGDRHARCSQMRRIYEMDCVDPANVVHFGVRGPRCHPLQLDVARSVGATVITSFEAKAGLRAAVDKALSVAHDGTDAVYLTLCSDVLDVAYNPGGLPDFCGLTSHELALAVYQIASAGLAGFDFVEIYPPSDPNNVSAHAGVWMTLYALSGLANHRARLGASIPWP